MRRLLLSAAVLLVFAAPAQADCLAPHSWVGGSTDLCSGTIVYGDYVDDDYGADTGQSNTTSRTASLAPSAGDEDYPTAKDRATADLIRLTMKVSNGQLQVTGLYNALYEPDSTVLAVAIDTDGNQATGGGPWGTLDVSSKGWDTIAFFSDGDPATNTISGTMPLPPGTHWRVQAVSAIKSTGHVMNVAFRGVNEQARAHGAPTDSDQGNWFEDDQAAALGKGDISQFGYDVDVADLTGGVTRAQSVGPGLHERVYQSKYTVPPQNEGVDVAGVPGRGNGGGAGVPLGFEQTFQYLGPYQPYGIYIPKNLPAHPGMQMLFHGSSSVMSGLVNQPGMQQRFGEDRGRILVVPEARGQNGFGSDISERDLLDVMDDVQTTYGIDLDHVFAGGYSQGGYITYRMSELWPDRFAGAVDWVGFTGDDENGTPAQGQGYTAGAVGNVIDFVGNLRWIPAFLLYSGADELVHVNTAQAMDNAFKATDNVFTYYFHPAAEHLTYAALDDWTKESADTKDLSLVHDPPRVTYRTASFLDDPALGIVHDHAYWVSEIRGRTKDYEDVDLTTYACGGSVWKTATGNGAGPAPIPWVSDYRQRTGATALPRRSALEGTLKNVASLSVDARATCLQDAEATYKIVTDGPAVVTLSDGRTLSFAAAGTHSGTLAAPVIAAAPRSRSCVSRRTIRLTLRRPRGMRVQRVVLSVNGRKVKVVRGNRARTVVSLRGLPRGAVRVQAVVSGVRHGHRAVVRDTRTYRTCTRKR